MLVLGVSRAASTSVTASAAGTAGLSFGAGSVPVILCQRSGFGWTCARKLPNSFGGHADCNAVC